MRGTIIFGIGFDDLRHIAQAFVGIVTGIWISRVADAVAGHIPRFARNGNCKGRIVRLFFRNLELLMQIRILHKQGRSVHAFARELSVSRGTVCKYLRQPGLSARNGPRKGRASKLDPFNDYLRDRIRNAAPIRLPATVASFLGLGLTLIGIGMIYSRFVFDAPEADAAE